MAETGIKWIEDPIVIIAALKKHDGRITFACGELGVCRYTLSKTIKESEELKKALEEIRSAYDSSLIKQAENVLITAMSKTETELACSLKASFFVLNNKGKDRGYSYKNPNQEETQQVLSDIKHVDAKQN